MGTVRIPDSKRTIRRPRGYELTSWIPCEGTNTVQGIPIQSADSPAFATEENENEEVTRDLARQDHDNSGS